MVFFQFDNDASNERNLEVKVWKYEFSGLADREKMLEKIRISTEFDMRYRGLVQFDGDDLVDYKRKIGSNKNGTEFLRVLAKHFTNNLENRCPSSWEECTSAFWEELIFFYYPHLMKISKEQKQSSIFLSQLKKFVRWLDHKKGTSCYQILETLTEDAASDLTICERLLNQLFLLEYPTMYEKDWNVEEELEESNVQFNKA